MADIVVIGIGGIGSHLIVPLGQYVHFSGQLSGHHTLVLIDGDEFMEHNRERQRLDGVGNKAVLGAQELARFVPGLQVRHHQHFIDDENVHVFIREGAWVLSCVDNHATRKVLSEHCETLRDVVLISGGNNLVDGNTQVYVKKGGVEYTPPITFLHPEIENPGDRNPASMSCTELAQKGEPQLVVTNFAAASRMLEAFWCVNAHIDAPESLPYTEKYFTMPNGTTHPVNRNRTYRNERNAA